jgi:hypothetical protein
MTLTADDDVIATVRRYAVERGTTVNAMVRAFLTELAARETGPARPGGESAS